VAIHFNVQAASLTLRRNLHLSALDSRSHWKNRVVRDQAFSLPNLWMLTAFRGWGMHVHLLPSLTGTQYSDYRRHRRDWEDHCCECIITWVPARGN
jgi:hypothetical protein